MLWKDTGRHGCSALLISPPADSRLEQASGTSRPGSGMGSVEVSRWAIMATVAGAAWFLIYATLHPGTMSGSKA